MVRQLAIITGLLVSSISIAGQQVTVTGTGVNLSDAKRDAMHEASMHGCPTALVDDREFANREMIRSNVTAYNGCIVKNYKLLNTVQENGMYQVTIQADMIPSNLPLRIINKHPEWFYHDLDQHNERFDQVKTKINNGIGLVDEVFYDYPFKAFDLQQSNFTVSYQGLTSYINVNFKISWNQNYIKAIAELLSIVSDGKAGFFDNSQVYKISLGNVYAFNDYIIPNRITDHLIGNRPVVRMRLTSADEKVSYLDFCRPLNVWVNLFNPYNQSLTVFYPRAYLQDTISMPIPGNVPNDAKAQLDVVPRSFCKEFQ